MPGDVLVFLLVSCLSWVFQAAAFARLAVRRARTPVEGMVGTAHLRTIACRVLAATVYVAVAAVQVAGDGTLSAEALIVFASVQTLWISNTLLDMRLRRRLPRAPRHSAGHATRRRLSPTERPRHAIG